MHCDTWFCIGCNTCSMACLHTIDIASMMDVMREIAIQTGAKIAEPEILNFHREVINYIEGYGRTHNWRVCCGIRLIEKFDFDNPE